MDKKMFEEVQNRINKLQAELIEEGIEIAVIIENADLYYFSGTIQAEYLIVPQQGEAILLVRKGIDRALNESPLTKIIEFRSSRNIPDILTKQGIELPNNLGLELDVLAYKNVIKLQKVFNTDDVINLTSLIRQIRMVKSDYEIELVRKAAQDLGAIPRLVKDNLKEGMSEVELSAIIEKHFRDNGHPGLIRMRGLNNNIPMGITSAGASAQKAVKIDALCGGAGLNSSFGIGASQKIISKGEPIVLDFMNIYQGYHADQTRIATLGEPSSKIKNLYKKMLRFLNELSQYLTPEYSWLDVYNKGLELAEKLGVKEYYLGSGSNEVRFVGHGVGLELNEYPFLAPGLDHNLQAGMTVALEPKLLIPNLGLIGIENTYLVTEEQPERLTNCSEELIKV